MSDSYWYCCINLRNIRIYNTIIQILTDSIPAKAGIDPYLVLIDREMDNNVCEVKEAGDSLLELVYKIENIILPENKKISLL